MERWRILHKESDFTVIDNGIFKDSSLTLAERGFLCTVMSLPESWNFSTSGMAELLHESLGTIKVVINRLVDHGYCKKGRIFDSKTRRIIGYDYTFYEVKNGNGCASIPQTKIPTVENPATEIPAQEFCHQSSTNSNKVLIESNTDKKKDISISKEKFDFLASLRSLGVSKETAEEWLQVRRTKRLTNTRIAFDRIADEISRSGRSAEDCIRTSVEHSWGGFKAEWMPPKKEEVWHGTMEEYLEECYRNGTLKREHT